MGDKNKTTLINLIRAAIRQEFKSFLLPEIREIIREELEAAAEQSSDFTYISDQETRRNPSVVESSDYRGKLKRQLDSFYDDEDLMTESSSKMRVPSNKIPLSQPPPATGDPDDIVAWALSRDYSEFLK